VAEVAKPAGVERRLALAPGRYTVKKRLPGEEGLLVSTHAVGASTVAVDEAAMDRVALARDPQKGYGGARWSLTVGAGGQRFYDAATRDGLFPPASLLGAELAVRDDLGHGLAWGLDAAAGGGEGKLRLAGVDPIPVRFSELSGGAALWKEWRLGALSLAAGGRVGFLFLARSFPPAEQLPAQRFFTVAPGLTGAAAWRFTHRLSAVARVRASWLFYNVDENRSLGFAELLLGMDYALSD
jgi:hypothetical protein